MTALKTMQFIDATDIEGLFDTTLLDNVSFSFGDASFTLVTLGALRDEVDDGYGDVNLDEAECVVLRAIDELIKLHGEDALVRFIG